jgi:hypothetical protein
MRCCRSYETSEFFTVIWEQIRKGLDSIGGQVTNISVYIEIAYVAR